MSRLSQKFAPLPFNLKVLSQNSVKSTRRLSQFIKVVKKMYVRITDQYPYSHQLIKILKNSPTIACTPI